MISIKSDLHIHTRDDPNDIIDYSTDDLFKAAQRKNIQVLAITNHDQYIFSRELEHRAADHGILLIPGIEREIEGKHVLILNGNQAVERIDTFEELRRAKPDGLFVIAPHPFFKASICLEEKLLEHLDLFDAIEFTFFYSRLLNLNKKAVRLAQEEHIPVVGNSDCHMLKNLAICHSILWVESVTREEVFSAICDFRVEPVTRPMPVHKFCLFPFDTMLTKRRIRKARLMQPTGPESTLQPNQERETTDTIRRKAG